MSLENIVMYVGMIIVKSNFRDQAIRIGPDSEKYAIFLLKF